jgi:hypothetical protein
MVVIDRKHAWSSPEGLALPLNSCVLGAVEGEERCNLSTNLYSKGTTGPKNQRGSKMLDLGGSKAFERD